MLHAMPVSNCMHFLMPTSLDDWKAYDVPGIVGVLRRGTDGQYHVIDAFDCSQVPSARQLTLDSRFSDWVASAGGMEMLRFDVFLMPTANPQRRGDVITLLERSCGFHARQEHAYAHAV